MKRLLIFCFLFSLLGNISCKKSASTCNSNVGKLVVNFSDQTIRHVAQVTISQSSWVIIRSHVGSVSDTFQFLNQGTYPVYIASFDSSGTAVNSQNTTITITPCNQSVISVPF
jgi:hypothetical protein